MDLGAERLENEIAIYRMCTIPVEDRAHPLFEDFIDGDFADDQSPLITPSMTEFIRKARGLSIDEADSERVLGPERYRNANAYQFEHMEIEPWDTPELMPIQEDIEPDEEVEEELQRDLPQYGQFVSAQDLIKYLHSE